MLLIVSDSFSLSSQNASLADKAARADIWARVLFGLIPAHRLQDAFDRAFAEHESVFPVNAYEIKAAWEKIRSEDRERAAAADQEERKANPTQFCEKKGEHVTDDGEVDIVNFKNPSELIRLPCRFCRPKAHDAARARWIEKNGGYDPKPTEVLRALEQTVSKKPDRLSIPETAPEILVRARNDVGRELFSDPDNEVWRRAQKILTGAWKYAYENPY